MTWSPLLGPMAFLSACFCGGTQPHQPKERPAHNTITKSNFLTAGEGSKDQEESCNLKATTTHTTHEDVAVTLGTGPLTGAASYDSIRRVSCDGLSVGRHVLSEDLRLQNHSDIMAQELRSAMIMESSPAIITVLSYQGKVLHQNPLSKVYFGNRVAAGSYGPSDDVLSLLFTYDPVKGHRMLNEISKVGIGGVWKAVVRVPPSLNGQREEVSICLADSAYSRLSLLREPSRSVDLPQALHLQASRKGAAAPSGLSSRRLNDEPTTDSGHEECNPNVRPLSWMSSASRGPATRFQPLQQPQSGASAIGPPCNTDSSTALAMASGGGRANGIDLLRSHGSLSLPFISSGRRDAGVPYIAPRRNSSTSRNGATSCRWGPITSALAPAASSEHSAASYSMLTQQDPLATSTFATFHTGNHNMNPTNSIPSTRDFMALVATAATTNTTSNLDLPATSAPAIGPTRSHDTDAATSSLPPEGGTPEANNLSDVSKRPDAAALKEPITRRKPTRTSSCYVLGTSAQNLVPQPQSSTVGSRALAFALSLGTSPVNAQQLPASAVVSLGAPHSRAASVTSIGMRPLTATGSCAVVSTTGVTVPPVKTYNLPTVLADDAKCDTATGILGTDTDSKSLQRQPTRANSFVGRPFQESSVLYPSVKHRSLPRTAMSIFGAAHPSAVFPQTAPTSLVPSNLSQVQMSCASNSSLPPCVPVTAKQIPMERPGSTPNHQLDTCEHTSVSMGRNAGSHRLSVLRPDGHLLARRRRSREVPSVHEGEAPSGGDDDYMQSPFRSAILSGLDSGNPSSSMPVIMAPPKTCRAGGGPASAPPQALVVVSTVASPLPSLSLPLTSSAPKPALASTMSPAAAPVECWHEVWATAARDPVSGEDVIVLTQMDVTAKVVAERHLALVMETEHRLVEQLFPRHILQYITEEWTAAEREVVEDAGTGTPTGSGHQGPRKSGASGKSLRWRPVIRDCNALATWHPEVTLLFADIKGFTPMCKEVEPRQVMGLLNSLYSRYDSMLDEYGVFKVETIGDCYFVAGGLIHEDEDGMAAVRDGGSNEDPLHAERVFMFAKAMLSAARQVRLPTTGEPVEIRIGLHTGPVVSGVVGTHMPRFCLFGDTVNTASRMESTGVPGAIHASDATFKRLAAGVGWEPTGGIEVKGKGRMSTYIWKPSEDDLREELRQESLSGLPSTAAAALEDASRIVECRGLQSGITMRLPQPVGGKPESCQQRETGARPGGEQEASNVMASGDAPAAKSDTATLSSFAGFRTLRRGGEEGSEEGGERMA